MWQQTVGSNAVLAGISAVFFTGTQFEKEDP
jgi:hypothetical protein